jgi:hypothetical protein
MVGLTLTTRALAREVVHDGVDELTCAEVVLESLAPWRSACGMTLDVIRACCDVLWSKVCVGGGCDAAVYP